MIGLTVGLITGCGNDPSVTLEEYNEVELGMSMKQVAKIFGTDGTCDSVDTVEGGTEVYYYSNPGDSYASIMFSYGEVAYKTQANLTE